MFFKSTLPFLFSALALFLYSFGFAVGLETPPEVELSCDKHGFYIRLDFLKPFRGSVYASGHEMNSLCSFPFSLDEKVVNVFIPVASCGTKIRETEKNFVLHNTVIMKEHSIKKANNVVRPISCAFPRAESPLVIQNDQPVTKDHKDVEAWMELKLAADLFGAATSTAELGVELVLAIYVNDGGKNKELNVRNCIAHDAETVEKSHSVVKVAEICAQSDIMADFKVTKSSKSDLMAYSTFKAFKFPTKGQLYLTCALQLCKDTCSKGCDYAGSNSVSAVTKRRVMKRSVDVESSDRHYEERNRLMKETIKALASKLMMYGRRPRVVDKSSIEKRILNSSFSETEAAVTLAETQVLEETSTSDFYEDLTTLSFINLSPESILDTLAPLREISEDYKVSNVTDSVDLATDSLAVSSLLPVPSQPPTDIVEFNITNNILVVSPSDQSNGAVVNTEERNDCVPRVRFALVTGLLCFVAFCLLLTCVTLVYFTRREKKKRRIDNFLLYNFN